MGAGFTRAFSCHSYWTIAARTCAEVPPIAQRPNAIVVGVSRSPRSWQALAWAAAEAHERCCTLRIVQTLDFAFDSARRRRTRRRPRPPIHRVAPTSVPGGRCAGEGPGRADRGRSGRTSARGSGACGREEPAPQVRRALLDPSATAAVGPVVVIRTCFIEVPAVHPSTVSRTSRE
jgi:hypothetical protein